MSEAGGMLLVLLLRVRRLSNRPTSSSKSSREDLSAGDKSFSFFRDSLTDPMVDSTSISWTFTVTNQACLSCSTTHVMGIKSIDNVQQTARNTAPMCNLKP